MNIRKIVDSVLRKGKNRELFGNVIAAFLIKGLSLFISVFSMPLYMKYFSSQEALGLWFTILSVVSWVFSFDLGLGNGLRNKLVEAFVKGDKLRTKQYVSSAYGMVLAFSAIVVIVANILFPVINWNDVFNIDTSLLGEEYLLLAMRILFSGMMITFVLKLINSILYAMQKSAMNNFLALVSSSIPLIYILFSVDAGIEQNLINLSIVHVLAQSIPLLVATVFVFANKDMRDCCPTMSSFNWNAGKMILKLGGAFFGAQIAFMLVVSTNEMLISYAFHPKYVVEYQVYNRLFTFIGSLFMLALTPVWSIVTKAVAEEDFAWVKRIFRWLVVIAVFAAVCELLVVPILQPLVNIWLREQSIVINYAYAAVFALYGGVYILNIVITTISNGVGHLKLQTLCYSLGAITRIVIIVFLYKGGEEWILVVLFSAIVLLFFCIIETRWIKRYLDNKCFHEVLEKKELPTTRARNY